MPVSVDARGNAERQLFAPESYVRARTTTHVGPVGCRPNVFLDSQRIPGWPNLSDKVARKDERNDSYEITTITGCFPLSVMDRSESAFLSSHISKWEFLVQ
jgi:hypothetical protein